MARGKPWYEPNIKWRNFGAKYDFSPWPVAGEDIALPQGTPITALFAGAITALYYDGGGGQLVIKIDNPALSRSIPYYWYAHLDAIDPILGVGAHVNEGQFIGYSGGQLTGGGPVYPAGFSHHPNDALHSTGPHILYALSRTAYINAAGILPDLEPYWLLDYARAINLPWQEGSRGRASSGSQFQQTSSRFVGDIPAIEESKKPPLDLSPNASVSEVLGGIDYTLTFTNVFDVQANKVNLGPVGEVTSPVDWATRVGTNTLNNAGTAFIRLILIIIGFWIFYSLINRVFDISNLSGGDIKSYAGSAGKSALRAIL